MSRRLTGVGALTLGFLATYLVSAAIAWGGAYDVYACEAPTLNTLNYSWGGTGAYPGYKGDCGAAPTTPLTNRGLITRMVPGEAGKPSSFPNGAWSGLWFQAPGGTTIAGMVWSGRLAVTNWSEWRAGIKASGGAYLIGGDRCASLCLIPSAPATPTWTPAPAGTTHLIQLVQCAVSSCTTGASMHTHWSQVRLNDLVAPRAGLSGPAAEQWVNGATPIVANGIDDAGGGIRQVYVRVDNGPARSSTPTGGCDARLTIPCPKSRVATLSTGEMAEGRRKVDVVAVDAGSNAGVATRYLRVDKTKPRQVGVSVDGGEAWHRRNSFTARWTPIADTGAPITSGSYELCKPGRRNCLPPRPLSNTNSLTGLQLPDQGSWEFRVALHDAAGNTADFADARVAMLRLDSGPPELRIAKQDPADPLLIEAPVSDSLSGVATGQIEIRRRGTSTWQELPTKVRDGRLEATIDDERRPDGQYDLRAIATDRAGNQAATGVVAAARSLPVRIKTTLRAKMARTIGRRGRKRLKLTRSRRVRYGRTYQVRGRLVTRDGQPLEDTGVNVYAKPDRLGGRFRLVGVVRTDRNGRLRYRATARQSRVLRLRYEGSHRVRSSQANVRLKVPARISFVIRPRSVLNGEYAHFAGRVRGPIPPGGKLVALQAFTAGRWGTFQTVRTDKAGHYRSMYRFVGARGRVRYRLRAVATREPLFPYHSGYSRQARIRVRGL